MEKRKAGKRSPEENKRRREQNRLKRYNFPLNRLEAAILSVLPKRGEAVGLKDTAWTVKIITDMIVEIDDTIDHDVVTGRIRSMLSRELVTMVMLTNSQGPGYQITKRGEEFLRDYIEKEKSERKA